MADALYLLALRMTDQIAMVMNEEESTMVETAAFFVSIWYATIITQPIAALIDQTRSKFRDNTAIEISQFIQSKINQSKLFLLYNTIPEMILVSAGFHWPS